MHEKYLRFESPARVNELDAENTIRRIGVKNTHTICDLDPGLVTIPAVKMTSGMVYSLNVDKEALLMIREKAFIEDVKSIKTIQVAGNVLQEIQRPSMMLEHNVFDLWLNFCCMIFKFHKP